MFSNFAEGKLYGLKCKQVFNFIEEYKKLTGHRVILTAFS